jgi:hypothetical protein
MLVNFNISILFGSLNQNYVGFEVFTAVVLKSIFFWDMSQNYLSNNMSMTVISFDDPYLIVEVRDRQHQRPWLLV